MAATGGGGAAGGAGGGINLFDDKVQTDIARLIFGDANIDLLSNMKIKVRDIYEVSGTDTQCNNTIGVVDVSTGCWICGLPIQYNENGEPYSRRGYIEPGQCEHILPIVHAYMFIGLYSNIEAKGIISGDIKNSNGVSIHISDYINHLKNLEYGWSHETCNLIKNDDVYIEHGLKAADNGEYYSAYIVNIHKIKDLLNNIWDKEVAYKSTPYFRKMLHHYYKNYTNFEAICGKQIHKRMQDVADHMNHVAYGGVPFPALALLAGTASLLNPPNSIAASILGSERTYTVKIPQPGAIFSLINKTIEKHLSTFIGGKALFYEYMTPEKKKELLEKYTIIYTHLLNSLSRGNSNIQSKVDKVCLTMVAYENLMAFMHMIKKSNKPYLIKKLFALSELVSHDFSDNDVKEVAAILTSSGGGVAAGGAGASSSAMMAFTGGGEATGGAGTSSSSSSIWNMSSTDEDAMAATGGGGATGGAGASNIPKETIDEDISTHAEILCSLKDLRPNIKPSMRPGGFERPTDKIKNTPTTRKAKRNAAAYALLNETRNAARKAKRKPPSGIFGGARKTRKNRRVRR